LAINYFKRKKIGAAPMTISISKETLFDGLQKAYPIIPLKSSLQVLSNFRLFFNHSQLEITATDLDQSMRIGIPAQGDESFDITVNARKFFEIIRELPPGMVSIAIEENVLIIKTDKNFSCKIAGADAHDFPGFPEIASGVEFEINPVLLKNMIPKSSFAVAKDESRACLAGILWEIYPDKTVMVATDGHRLGSSIIKDVFSISEKIIGIISPKSLNHLVRILETKQDEKLKVVINEKYVAFTSRAFTLCTKLVEGPYPDYNKVIPLSNPREALVDRTALVNAVKRASVLSNQKTHLVKFSFSEGALEVVVINKEIGGEAREKIDVDYQGDEHNIGFNGQYFNEILDIIKTAKIKMKMNTQISACLIFPVYEKEEEKTSDDLFLIMPLRIMET
jgi:DNA polymerase-3 subunit beta